MLVIFEKKKKKANLQVTNPNASGTGTAPIILKANAGVALPPPLKRFSGYSGDPYPKTDNNNPINGGELNEYGLQAVYSLLGVSNRAYVVRADVDLGELEASADASSATH